MMSTYASMSFMVGRSEGRRCKVVNSTYALKVERWHDVDAASPAGTMSL